MTREAISKILDHIESIQELIEWEPDDFETREMRGLLWSIHDKFYFRMEHLERRLLAAHKRIGQ